MSEMNQQDARITWLLAKCLDLSPWQETATDGTIHQLFQLGVQMQTAVLQSVTDLLDVIHANAGLIMRCLSCVPAFSDQRSGRP